MIRVPILTGDLARVRVATARWDAGRAVLEELDDSASGAELGALWRRLLRSPVELVVLESPERIDAGTVETLTGAATVQEFEYQLGRLPRLGFLPDWSRREEA